MDNFCFNMPCRWHNYEKDTGCALIKQKLGNCYKFTNSPSTNSIEIYGNKEVVQKLEFLLDKAKAGQISTIACATIEEGDAGIHFSGNFDLLILSALRWLEQDIMDSWRNI